MPLLQLSHIPNPLYTIHSHNDDLNTPETAPVPVSSLVCGDDSGSDDHEVELDGVSPRKTQKRYSRPLQEAAAWFILKTKD